MPETFTSGPILGLRFKSLDEFRNYSEKNKTALIIIDEQVPEWDKYPFTIEMILSLPSSFDLFWSQLPSRKRNIVKRKEEEAKSSFQCKLVSSITEKQYGEWKAGYDQFIGEMTFGRNKIAEDVYRLHSQSLMIYEIRLHEELLGGVLYQKKDKQLRMKYAWYSPQARNKNASTSAVLDGIKFAIENGFSEFSFGRDTNLYGGHLSIGLHQFKEFWGAKARIVEKANLRSIGSLKVQEEFLPNPIGFYLVENGSTLKFFLFSPTTYSKGDGTTEL